MNLYKNRYKIQSSRYRAYNYSSEGFYFVTWCVKDMRCVLGRIVNDTVMLSDIGKIMEEEILKTERVRNNILIDEYIVMPNHVHCIIHIGSDGVETCRWHVSNTGDAAPPRLYTDSVGSIINQIKSQSTKRIRKELRQNIQWQPRFYDHIIRNDTDLQHHRDYIGINPIKWPQDEYYLDV